MNWRRPLISVEALVLLVTVYLLGTANRPFWRAAMVGRDPDSLRDWGFAAALAVLVGAVYFIALALVATRRTVRPLLGLVVVVGSLAAYYMDRYAIYLDRAMVRNILATHYGEAVELFSPHMAGHVLAWGALPAAILWWPRLKSRSWRQATAARAAWMIAAAVLAVGAILPVFADFASLMRNHKEVRHLVTPGNLVAALAGQAWGHRTGAQVARTVIAPDAALGAGWAQRRRPTLFILVVGETARARNFSLNGYERLTNPELAAREVVSFSRVTACGTSTEVSLPCMFSAVGRRDYDEERIRTHESLLHVLARAGFQVQWRDNQSGCKGVCADLPTLQMDKAHVEGLCPEGQCHDEVLLHGLDSVLRDARGNLFVVMHQLGSHGPAYYRRYPATFRRFTPACEKDDLRLCSTQEIRNAYDNTILYTDHMLGRVIDFLRLHQDRYDTAMLYLSDHGESLGEGGLYLHGMPYRLAPDVQREVPMVAWLSPSFRQAFAVDGDCLRQQAHRPVGHDHLFHSVLGLLDVSTRVYDQTHDVFAPCRPQGAIPTAPRIRPQETGL